MAQESLEARAYTGLCLVVLAPALVAGLWRPLIAALGEDPAGRAPGLVLATVLLAGACALLPSQGRGRVAGGAAIVALASLAGLAAFGGLSAAVSLTAAAGAALWVAPRMRSALPQLDGLARRRPLGAALWTALGLGTVVLSARTAVFIADPTLDQYAVPSPEFVHWHLCLTAYLHAAELIQQGVANVYDLSLAPPLNATTLPPALAHMAPFHVDRFGYPPQFILAPLALIRVTPDFAAQRALWYGLNVLFVAYARWRMALWVGPKSGWILLIGGPSMLMLSAMTFQVGNVQLAVEAVAILAMMAFADGADRRGGGLLAAATLAKIAPGLLGVVLLVQRRWRGVAWTVAWALGFTALSLAVMGWGPFDAFLHEHLPMVASGEAYDFLDDDRGQIFQNLSPFAIPFKLGEMGLTLDPWQWGPRATTPFTVAAFALAAWAGRRRMDRRGSMALWLIIIGAACLRSPMAPSYTLTCPVLALCLYAAELRGRWGWTVVFAGCASALFFLPDSPLPMVLSLSGQLAIYGVMGWLALRRWDPLDPEPEIA